MDAAVAALDMVPEGLALSENEIWEHGGGFFSTQASDLADVAAEFHTSRTLADPNTPPQPEVNMVTILAQAQGKSKIDTLLRKCHLPTWAV